MRKWFILPVFICLFFTSCVDGLFGPRHSIEGKWGMVSGGIKKNGVFSSLEKEDGFLKTIEFNADGRFKEVCGTVSASGTYRMKGNSSISYTYEDVSGSGPEYFAIHMSGTWTFYFWSEDSFTLYDFSSPNYEVSMTFDRIH